jgi:recombination associated protein RdgC
MHEDIEFELLPKAFCAQKRWTALIDTKDNRLIINTSSISQADQVTALLRKAIPGLSIDPWFSEMNLCEKFLNFITHPETMPNGFTLASDCHLISPDDEKKKIQCKGYELPADEVLSLLEQGMHPTELSFIWQDRLQFTFTNQLALKRIKCLDYLIDEFSEIGKLEEQIEQQDAALMLLSGELRGLVSALNAHV